jgi:hypothetical protein
MNATRHAQITVNRHPGDRHRARYWLADLEDVRWDYTSGGYGKHAKRPDLYAFVYCTGAVEGEVSHFGAHGDGCPHRIAVHIPARHNDSQVMEYLRSIAGPKPDSDDGFSTLFHNPVK